MTGSSGVSSNQRPCGLSSAARRTHSSAFAGDDGVHLVSASIFLKEEKGGQDARAPLPPPAISKRGLKLPEQEQDQQDHDDQTKAAAAIITGAIKRSAADAAEAAEQGDNENNENDLSE